MTCHQARLWRPSEARCAEDTDVLLEQVMPEFRGKGVGRALTAFAGVLARERGCDVMQVEPLAAGTDDAFWTKMGFSSCVCGTTWTMRFLTTPDKTTKTAKRRKAAAPIKRELKRRAVVDAEEE